MVDDTSCVNLRILETLTVMQYRMARLEISQLKREEGECIEENRETNVLQSAVTYGTFVLRH